MKRVRRDERGSSLIIALLFLTVFSLWLSATLTYAKSGLHVASSTRVEPGKLYGADGAVEEAIQKVRYGGNSNPPVGAEGAAACNSTANVNGRDYYIKCEPQSGSGQAAVTGSSPDWGIIALSNGIGGEAGIEKGKNGVIKVDGGVFSHNGLSVVNGSVCPGTNCNQLNLCPNNTKTVTDAIFVGSGGGNTPTKTVTSFAANFQNSTANPGKTDVGVPISGSGIAGGATIQAVAPPITATMSANAPAVGSNKKIKFREDYPALNSWCNPVNPGNVLAVNDPNAPIAHGTLRVLGGTANCDRSNASQTVAVALQCPAFPPSASDLVAEPNPGDPVTNDPNYDPDQTSFGAAKTVPACTSASVIDVVPGKYTDVAGLNNLINNCATSKAQKLIWFHPGTYYFDFTGAANPTWSFNNPYAWVVAGDKKWTTRSDNSTQVFTGSITLGKQNGKDVVTLTAGSSVFSRNDVGSYIVPGTGQVPPMKITGYTSASTVTLASGTAFSGMFVVTDSGLYSDSACDKTPTGEHAGDQWIFGGPSQMNVSNMKVEMCAPAANGHQQIAVYGAKATVGSLVAQTGCITLAPYQFSGGSAGCAFLTTTSDLLIHGTVYAPLSPVFLAVKNYDYQIVSRGIVARVIAMDMFPNAAFNDPVIFSPDYGTVVGADRLMLMTACLGTSCAADGSNAKLRALICIKDNTDDTVPCFAPPQKAEAVPEIGHAVTVQSWTFVH
jgi:hypothetical protein